MANFCPECGAAVEGMTFCPDCGTPLDGASQQVPTQLSDDQQVAILDREIAELAKEGWRTHVRPTPFEVSLKRKSGLTARQFFTLWFEADGGLWTNQFGVMEGGRLRDIPTLFSNPYSYEIQPVPWKPAPPPS